jgi:hypothetical protein
MRVHGVPLNRYCLTYVVFKKLNEDLLETKAEVVM